MTFSEAFYGTYKIDKKDGKPHLKERIFAPVDGFWSGVIIFGGVVGTIILLLTFAAHVQVALGTFAHPAENGALTPDAQYTLWGVLVAFIFAFFVLAIPRWFLCRGTMQFSFIGAFLILLAAQLISAFSLNNTTPDVGNVLWVIVTGLLLVFLITCAVCTVSAGLTALVNYFIAKYRMAHAKPVTT